MQGFFNAEADGWEISPSSLNESYDWAEFKKNVTEPYLESMYYRAGREAEVSYISPPIRNKRGEVCYEPAFKREEESRNSLVRS